MRGLRRSAVAIAAGLFLVSGCGSSPSSQAVAVDATPVGMRHAAEATLAKGTSKVDFTIRMTVEGSDITLSGTGAQDPANKRLRMSFDAKQLFENLAAEQSVPPEVSSLFDQPIETILDDTVMYMRFPAFASMLGAGKEWIKIDLAAAGEGIGDLVGGGGGAFGSDPSSFVQFLQGAGKVTKVGEEEVRGVSTTHFSGTYTLADALAALPADQRDKAEKAFRNLGLSADAETQEIPFDAWIDGDGLIRRLETSFDAGQLAPPGSPSPFSSMSQTLEFSDFGAPVDIQVPSEGEVQDLSALLAGATSKFSTVASSIN